VFGVRDATDLHTQHLEDWRNASKRVMRSYKAWCAASRGERHQLHVAFLDALRREEQAALQVERDATQSGGFEQSGQAR
jgi:hypothetical protein